MTVTRICCSSTDNENHEPNCPRGQREKRAMSAGIDYGMGLTNIDHGTGIRYGVIPANDVLQNWADESDSVYDEEDECCDCDPIGFKLEDSEGYEAHQSYDSPDIFITKSPYYTFARFCSPCAPGAGYLRNYDPEGVKTYCFGKGWFEDGECPYPVYCVDNNECIYQPQFAVGD